MTESRVQTRKPKNCRIWQHERGLIEKEKIKKKELNCELRRKSIFIPQRVTMKTTEMRAASKVLGKLL